MPDKSQDIFTVVLIAALLLAIIIGYFLYSFMRQQRTVLAWQQARIAVEIKTLEAERKRIAGDLHDEIGPMLSAVKLQINHLEPTEETELAALERSSEQIDHIIQRFRDISFNLLPNTLVRKGLIKAMEEFIHRTQEAHHLAITLKTDPISLTQEKEINIYRIVQEIVHNTVKHARATKMDIILQQKKAHFLLQTADDGIGFEYEEKKQHASGLGLMNIQSRVEVLGGDLTVQTTPGRGTAYFIEIPFS